MKLYTEEEMRQAIGMARNGVMSEDNIIVCLNFVRPPMELPSDEEIEDRSGFEYPAIQQDAFIGGAKWMRDKIQGGNK